MVNKYNKGYLLRKYGKGRNNSFGIMYDGLHVKEVFIKSCKYNKDYPNITLACEDDPRMPFRINVNDIERLMKREF